DSARRARDTEVERIVTGKAPPTLNVKMPRTVRRDTVGGVAYAAGVLSGNLYDFDLRGNARGENVALRGNFVRKFTSDYAWTNARTPNAKLAFGVDADSLMVSGFALDAVKGRVSYDKPGGHIDVAAAVDDQLGRAGRAGHRLRAEESGHRTHPCKRPPSHGRRLELHACRRR